MILKKIPIGPIETNCYILAADNAKEAVIIDPGGDAKLIKKELDKLGLTAKIIINTHGHIDHIASNDDFDAPKYIHKDDADFLTNPMKNLSLFMARPMKFAKASRLLNDGDIITLNDLNLKVIHTPGHTPGGICLAVDNIIFTGDTLFNSGVGRTDFSYASQKDLMDSIKNKLLKFDDSTVIYPGHGPSSTIGNERKYF